eukprot:UN22840
MHTLTVYLHTGWFQVPIVPKQGEHETDTDYSARLFTFMDALRNNEDYNEHLHKQQNALDTFMTREMGFGIFPTKDKKYRDYIKESEPSEDMLRKINLKVGKLFQEAIVIKSHSEQHLKDPKPYQDSGVGGGFDQLNETEKMQIMAALKMQSLQQKGQLTIQEIEEQVEEIEYDEEKIL